MNSLFRYSIIALSFFAVTFSSCKTTNKLSTKEALLRFTPTKGDQYVMSMKMGMLMDGPQTMNMTMQMDNNLKIGDVGSDGAFQLDNLISKITMNMKNPMMSIDYDSDNPDSEDPTAAELHNSMKNLLNKNMVSKMSNRGELLESPDYNELFGDDPDMAGQIDQMNQTLESSFIKYPEKALKVGDSWNSTSDVEGQVPMTQNFTYTVKEITLTNVILGINGTIKFSPEAMMAGSGDFKGTMVINREDGFVNNSNIKQNLNMSMMGMDMKTTTDINLTLTKKGK